jgi:hypothetical protein
VFLQIQNLHHQWQMLEELETQQLTCINVKANEIQWVKEGKECMLQSELFDIKSIRVKGDQIILQGLFDNVEKKIKKSIEDNSKNEQNSNKAQQLVKLFSLTVTNTETEKLTHFIVGLKHIALFINTIYTTPFPDYTTPPPKIC